MYKIINNKAEYLRQYEIIMSEYQLYYNLSNENVICESILHCSQDFGAFNLCRVDLFESLKETSNIITDEWLNTDIVNELPNDWTWHFTDLIRIIIPNYLILKDERLTNLISYAKTYDIHNVIDESNTYLYVDYIMEIHRTLFNEFENITIENL